MIYLCLLLGKFFSDPESLPGVQHERERMRLLGNIARAAYMMGFKDALVLVAILVALGLLVFWLPRWLGSLHHSPPPAPPSSVPAPPPGSKPDPLHPWG